MTENILPVEMKGHLLEKQISFVQSFLFARNIPYEARPTRWGIDIECEGVAFRFKKRNIDIYYLEVQTHGKGAVWQWQESLAGPFDAYVNDVNFEHCQEWLKRALVSLQYAHTARVITKAPDWIVFTVSNSKDVINEIDIRVRVSAWVRLNILGKDPYFKFLTGDDYYVANLSFEDVQSDRMNYRDFSSMIHAEGSPIGSSYTDGHAPEAHGNFMTGGPFTFIPGKARCVVSSDYVLPPMDEETWDIWLLVNSHQIKISKGE